MTEILALVGLGAFHGVNPGMGWLFAVALGLQRGERRAVFRALGPIAAGHGLSVAAVVGLLEALGTVVAPQALAVAAAAVLILYGGWLLARPRHLRWVGMRLRPRELILWSFLMATAHGAGLMLMPVLLWPSPGHAAAPTTALAVLGPAAVSGAVRGLTAVLVHTAAMLVAMGGIATAVYDFVGLGVLRRGWVNLDRVWALCLVTAGIVTIFT